MTALPDTIANTFPATAEEFFAQKPTDMIVFAWLFCTGNPHHFEKWVQRFLNLIRRLSTRLSKSWCGQKFLAGFFKISVRWVQEIIRRLKLIGVISTERHRRNHCAVNHGFLHSFGNSAGLTSHSENQETIEVVTSYMPIFDAEIRDHVIKKETRSIIGKPATIKSEDKPLNPIDTEIIETFEQTTGNNYQPGRDRAALATLKQYSSLAVIAGIMLSALRSSAPIRSMSYCIGAVKEIVSAQNNPKLRLSDPALAAYILSLKAKLNKQSRN